MTTPLDPRLLLRGYASGIFPMSDSRDADDVFWVEPRSRAIFPLHRFHVSRSLAKRLRREEFIVTRDRAFGEVIRACAARPETWINRDIERATLGLHAAGHAHSIECWKDGQLVGGVYGVRLGRAFFGESMFSRATDASKVALAWLVARMRAGHFLLLDCQFMTGHLQSLGAITVPRRRYALLLSAALGAAGSDTAGASFAEFAWADPVALPPPEFGALDRLLEERALAGAPGTDGQFITQLLGQTS